MSVIVKNMVMPKRCLDCPFMVSRDNDDCIVQSDEANAKFNSWDDMKASCPLVEIPTPYGRLGDLDKLMTEFMDSDLVKNQWTAKDNKIEVGDWVNIKNTDEELGIVTKEHGNQFYVLWADGSSGLWSSKSVVKTGGHFDIDKILDEMKGNNDK